MQIHNYLRGAEYNVVTHKHTHQCVWVLLTTLSNRFRPLPLFQIILLAKLHVLVYYGICLASRSHAYIGNVRLIGVASGG